MMTSKWNMQPCPLCGSGILHDDIKVVTQNYRGHTYTSKTSGAFCDKCEDGFVEYDAAEEATWLAFRDGVDAEEAAELTRIRKKLKLTKSKSARLTGGGKNAFARYESGLVKPVAAVSNLFRLLDHHPELLSELID